jgi:hypothetical protein
VQFEQEVAKRADRAFSTLSPGDEEAYARQIFDEQLKSHPVQIAANYTTNFIKYLLVPVESNVMRMFALYVSEDAYFEDVRIILGVMCLPVWLLSLMPPLGSNGRLKMYYMLVLGCLVYILMLSAIGTGSGERIRFPILAFMLPVVVWNIHQLGIHRRRWMEQFVSRGTALS